MPPGASFLVLVVGFDAAYLPTNLPSALLVSLRAGSTSGPIHPTSGNKNSANFACTEF